MSAKHRSKFIAILIIAIVFSLFQEASAQKKPKKTKSAAAAPVGSIPPEINYTISMSKPWTHLLEVEMRVKWAQMPANVELKMPVWTPGSYLVREFARHVQDFEVRDHLGVPVPWRKITKNTWQIAAGSGFPEITVKYRVYANELTVRTNELNDEHAFWNNAATLLFVKDQLQTPSTVKVVPFGNWKIATGLPAADAPHTFTAENYDVLYDSPFEVSDFNETSFDVAGKKHRIVITGEGNYDLQKLKRDTAKIVHENYKIFGELPYKDYTFIINLRGGMSGLEHHNSTALQTDRFAFKPEARYKTFLALIAHEHFHAFNVKRIRPDALGPFDYDNENYTKLLWVAEGGTAYYEGILLIRAGLISAEEMLSKKAAMIEELQEQPGRFQTSLEEASFDAWIKYYRQDENSVNNQVSYYDKGEIVNMLLDIMIRTASAGARSYDDVLRYLYTEFYKKGKNFTPEDFQKAAEIAAGKSLDDFFARYVRGTAEIDYSAIVNGIGLQLAANDNSRRAFFGANLVLDSSGRLIIRTIPTDTPAYEQGLNTGDQIVAIDGYRASQSLLQSYIAERRPGDKIKLAIFRFDKLREIVFTLGVNNRKDYGFVPLGAATDEQKKLYKDYLGADL